MHLFNEEGFAIAMISRPEEATKALREKVIKAIKIDIWHPVHSRPCPKMNQS
jgi:hypothetical protein